VLCLWLIQVRVPYSEISNFGDYALRTNLLRSAALRSGKNRGPLLTLATREATVSLEKLTDEVGLYPLNRPAKYLEFSILQILSRSTLLSSPTFSSSSNHFSPSSSTRRSLYIKSIKRRIGNRLLPQRAACDTFSLVD
jgi:hypothetical protein